MDTSIVLLILCEIKEFKKRKFTMWYIFVCGSSPQVFLIIILANINYIFHSTFYTSESILTIVPYYRYHNGALGGGSPVSHIEFVKWQSLLLIILIFYFHVDSKMTNVGCRIKGIAHIMSIIIFSCQ